MKQINQSEMLNALYKKYDLVYDAVDRKNSDIFTSKNFKIITRAGIQKIQAKLSINSSYDVVYIDPFWVALKGTFTMGEKDTEGYRIATTFGEASLDRKQFIKTSKSSKTSEGREINQDEVIELVSVEGNVKGSPPYLMAMAEKRALSRGVLQLAGLYELGVFGEDEADEFKKEINNAIKGL